MEEKTYDVVFSYTLDYVCWTCPRCGELVEKTGEDVYDLECEKCGYLRGFSSLDKDNTTSEIDSFVYESE